MRLCQGMFRLDIRKNVFTFWVARRWNRLPSKMLVFRRCLDDALNNVLNFY